MPIRVAFVCCLVAATIGCSRNHYRVRADRDAYARVIEKTQHTPWMPSNFNVYPAPNSRLYDPTCVNDPYLPTPSPQLYDYELPALPPRDNDRFRPSATASAEGMIDSIRQQQQQQQQPNATPPVPFEEINELDPPPAPLPDGFTDNNAAQFTPVAYQPESISGTNGLVARLEELAPEVEATLLPLDSPALYDQPVVEVAIQVPPESDESDTGNGLEDEEPEEESPDDLPGTGLVPIPESYWEQISQDCLTRMLVFPSVRAEYKATYGEEPNEDTAINAPKLALEDIIELTLLNSRELQTQKEILYQTALALTLERFDYQLKPSFGNNGTAANFTHNRNMRITNDQLLIPTTAQLEKMLYTGGDFLGRFANSVLLNFNGPQGFTADVSSELFFGLSQSLLQRDVRLENLTQAERDVVYAARNYARFRRELFVQQASDYYDLILQFRQIEINCQNYFTLAREFNQRSVEIRVGIVGVTRTQLDQVEQQVINGRQSIISTCTNLENALDGLKFRMGIPTEQPLDLDLSELNLLTLRDELAVNTELVARSRRRIAQDSQSESRNSLVVVGGMTLLAETMLDSINLRERLGEESLDATQLENALLGLRIEASEFDIFDYELSLQQELDGDKDSTRLIQRSRDVARSLLGKADLQIQLLNGLEIDEKSNNDRQALLQQLTDRMEQLELDLEDYIDRLNASAVTPGLSDNAEAELLEFTQTLQEELARFTDDLDTKIGRSTPESVDEFDRRAMELSDQMLSDSEPFLDTEGVGLVPIEIEMDDAMMTALVQRFDLMNERGFLADDWRQIKYAADELRSVLNLQASQSIRTRNGENRPFDFTFDDSTTTAGVTLDLPFNRRAQRNQYRASLFNYQSALRNVMQLEDSIKLSVRGEVRALKLDRQQYANDVAGAALAYERVTGTELEVRNGTATSRDFLESQTAYVQAVSNVASRHINYIVGRLQLFLDLESLDVGDDGFWDKLYDENYQPEPNYGLSGYEPAYGRLHPKLKYSKRIQRMRCVPNGHAMIHRYDKVPSAESAAANLPTE